MLKVNTIVYNGKEYLVADIPDVINGNVMHSGTDPIVHFFGCFFV